MTEQNGQALTVNQEQLRQEIAPVVAMAQSLVVRCAEDFIAASEYSKKNKAAQKKVHEIFDPICDAANVAWKKATALRGSFLNPLLEGDKIAKNKREAWQEEQDRIAEKERRRLQAEQDEKARKEQEKLRAQAQRAAEKGNVEKAEALKDRAESVVAPCVHVQTETPAVEGVTTRRVWEATVDDPRAFLAFVAQEQTGMWMGTVEINTAALNRMAKGEVAPTVPGVTYQRRIISASGSAR